MGCEARTVAHVSESPLMAAVHLIGYMQAGGWWLARLRWFVGGGEGEVGDCGDEGGLCRSGRVRSGRARSGRADARTATSAFVGELKIMKPVIGYLSANKYDEIRRTPCMMHKNKILKKSASRR